MANEASVVELLGDEGNVVDFTIPTGITVVAGTVLGLIDPRTASGSIASIFTAFAGIAAADKDSTDGSTNIPAYTYGIFDMTAGAAITAGDFVTTSGSNLIRTVGSGYTGGSGGIIIGKALETATGGEVIEIFVGGGF